MKIALAIITRDNKEDSILLERLLDSVKGVVDGIFITTDEKTGDVKRLCEKHNAVYSLFPWVNDFSKARNFNFSQVPEDYDYIMWSDVDDIWRNTEKLKERVEQGGKDAYSFWYLYDFDEDNQPVVAHKKTMIVRNDGSFIWKGKIHEDLDCQKEFSIDFLEGIDRLHLTSEERIEEAKERNVLIAKLAYEENNADPRNSFNYGNALIGCGKYEEAKIIFEQFLKESESIQEKFLIRQRLGSIEYTMGNRDRAEEHLLVAVGLQPNSPDAYLQLGQFYYDLSRLDAAEWHLLQGLVRQPSYNSMIVFNPRDYDYNPMNLLAKVYFKKSRPDLALPILEGCLKINPNNEQMKLIVDEMKKELTKAKEINDLVTKLENEKDDEKVKKIVDRLPKEKRSHPGICFVYNQRFCKTGTSGKDVVFYCGYTEHEWSPTLFRKKGFGGSEEAIIHLSKKFAAEGYNVEVYANIGTERIKDSGVLWKPFWEFNPRDAVDHLFLWRSPRMCDYDLNARNIYIDLHDVISPGEFTKKRLAKIKKVFVKTKFHKSLFPTIPEDKFVVIPNGINTSDFASETKDQMLIINTSSPDRSMLATTEVFRRVKEIIPEAKLEWAYGWDIFDNAHANDKKMLEWKENLVSKMNAAGVTQLGKIPQHEIAKLYEKANIFLYPTEFAEIDCISAKKAQLAGCQVICTDFAALEESVQEGVKIHSEKNKDNWCLPYQISFAVEDEKMIQVFVDKTVEALKKDIIIRDKAKEWGKTFDWSIVSRKWLDAIK